MRYNFIKLAAGLLAAACLAGCGGRLGAEPSNEPAEVRAAIMTAEAGIKEAVLFADPVGAVDAIYQSLESEPDLTQVEKDSLADVFGVSAADVDDVVAYQSNPKNGLCDVALILPKAGKADDVREALLQYAALRAESFKNYDILSAYSIAQNTAVFSQGDYVVMLMLPDNDRGREILDDYMPQ